MMMRKNVCFILCLLIIISIAGCSGGDNKSGVLSHTEGIDVDLTALSGTMVYSEVYHMMVSPRDYVGKTIKMSGQFNFTKDTLKGRNYYTVIISDATACCQKGVEFIWNGEHSYPEDYPAIGSAVTVVGVFDLYEEGGNTFWQLLCDEVTFVK